MLVYIILYKPDFRGISYAPHPVKRGSLRFFCIPAEPPVRIGRYRIGLFLHGILLSVEMLKVLVISGRTGGLFIKN